MPDTKCDVSVLVCVRLLLSIAQQAAARLTGKWRLTLCGGRRGREGRGVSSEAREVFFLFNEPGPFRCRVEAVVVVGGGEGGGKGAREERAGGGRGGRRGGGVDMLFMKAWLRSKKHAQPKRHLHIIPQVS